MKLKLLGEKVAIIPDNSDERVTASGIIIPKTVKDYNSHLKSGVIVNKGTGTPWNRMDELKIKDRIYFKKGAGKVHKEENAEYLILTYNEILFV